MQSSDEASENGDKNHELHKQILKGQKTGKFICTFEECSRQYQNVNAFKKHVKKKHSVLLSSNVPNSVDSNIQVKFENISSYQNQVDPVFDKASEKGDKTHELHKQILRGEKTGKFTCTFEECSRQYQNVNAFKKHVKKKHSVLLSSNVPNSVDSNIQVKFENISSYQNQVDPVFDKASEKGDKTHELHKQILRGEKTGKFTCTFEECSRQYQNVNAFKKHVKKKHSVLLSSNVPNSVDSNIQVKFENISSYQNQVDPVFDKASEKGDKTHELHKQILRGEKTGKFTCTFEECSRQYQNVNAFKKHVKKKHSVLLSSNVPNSVDSNIQVKFENISSYQNQVDPVFDKASEKGDKTHELHKQILRGEKTGKFTCTFEECSRQYQNVNAFKKHVKKKHSVLLSSNVPNSVDSNIQVKFENISSYQNQVDPVFDKASEKGDKTHELHKQILRGEKTGKFTCTFEECSRQYQNVNAFKKHVKKKHSVLFSSNVSNSVDSNNQLRFQNISSYQNQVDHDPVFETTIRPIKTDEEVLKDLQTTTLGFLSGMHSRVDVNRTAVESTFKNAKETVLANVCKAIKSKVEHTEINNIGQKNDLLYFVDRCSKICDFVDSEHKLIKHLTDEKVYVAPEKKIVYCAVQEVRNSGFPIPAIKQFEVIEIPLRRSLKQLFELPEVLSETLKYQKSLIGEPMNKDAENNEPLLYQNFVQCNLWRKCIKNHADKIIIPFFLYCDDYGVNNQLGAHARSQSICGIYVLFPTLPPQFQSKLENILLMFIFYSSVLKHAGNEKTLKGLVEEINFVQKEGIDIDVAGKVSKVYFKMVLVLGDNLSLNSILDYVQSFSAFYCCRFCRVHKFVMNYMTELDYSLLRNRSNYTKDIKAITSKGGIHEDSIFNSIDDFHILDNASVDITHDFYENVAHLSICNSLKYFIFEKKYFTLTTLNSRKAKFNYGINDSANLAGPIQKKHLDEYSLRASSSEMIILIQHLLTIIGDLVPRRDKVWLHLVNVVEIHDIIIYKEITKSDLEKLKLLITCHHKSYIKLFNDHLRPTAHNMLHYYDVIKDAGPLSGISTIRAEARHRPFKVTAESTCSRKNIPLRLAIKNQIVYANRLLSNKGFQAYNTDFSESTEVDISKLEGYASIREQIDLTKSYTSVKQIHATKKVVIGMFAMVFNHSLKFYKILYILIQRETGNFIFVTQEYTNIGFDKHFLAYGIKKKLPVEFKIIELKNLVRFPNESHFLPNGQQIIRLTHY